MELLPRRLLLHLIGLASRAQDSNSSRQVAAALGLDVYLATQRGAQLQINLARHNHLLMGGIEQPLACVSACVGFGRGCRFGEDRAEVGDWVEPALGRLTGEVQTAEDVVEVVG